MRNLVIVVVLVLCFSALTVAQELPKAEIFGGYSYLRADGGGDDTSPSNGWEASVIFNINENVGVVIDGNGAYASFMDKGVENYLVQVEQPVSGSTTGETELVTQVAQRDVYRKAGARSLALTFGPRFTFRQHERFQPFYHAMIGIRHSSKDNFVKYVNIDAYTPEEMSEFFGNDYTEEKWISGVSDNFQMIFGGGMDIVLSKRISARAFQADYVLTREYGDFVPDFRFAAGLVFKLGEK